MWSTSPWSPAGSKSQHTLAEVIAKPAGFLTNYMVRLRSHCASKSWLSLKLKINKPSPTAAIMTNVAMKAKVVTSMVRWFILRFIRIGKFPQIKSQHTLALKITRGLALDYSVHFPLRWPQITRSLINAGGGLFSCWLGLLLDAGSCVNRLDRSLSKRAFSINSRWSGCFLTPLKPKACLSVSVSFGYLRSSLAKPQSSFS